MSPDKKNHAFYTLYHRYNQNDTRATLNKFDFLTGEYTLLADSVTFRFQDINSYISLFLDENAGKLYAVIVTHDGNISTTDIYELNYPPLSTADVILPEKSRSTVFVVMHCSHHYNRVGNGIYNDTTPKKETHDQ